jgi:hypothetical protein
MPKQQQTNARLVAVAGDGGNPLPAYPGTPFECIEKRCECGTCKCVLDHVHKMNDCRATYGPGSTKPDQQQFNTCVAKADRERYFCMRDCKALCNKGFDPYPPKTQSL